MTCSFGTIRPGRSICIGRPRIKNTRVNQLIKDIERHPFEGIGKPEPLKGALSGFWSRRIDETNRLVYRIRGEDCQIAQCKGHYQD